MELIGVRVVDRDRAQATQPKSQPSVCCYSWFVSFDCRCCLCVRVWGWRVRTETLILLRSPDAVPHSLLPAQKCFWIDDPPQPPPTQKQDTARANRIKIENAPWHVTTPCGTCISGECASGAGHVTTKRPCPPPDLIVARPARRRRRLVAFVGYVTTRAFHWTHSALGARFA